MKKVSTSKIATTYALALYEAASLKNAVSKVYANIVKLQQEIVKDKDFVKYFANPLWNKEAKIDALKAICSKMKFCNEMQNCLMIIADNNRFAELAEILQEFVHLYYQKNNIIEVEVQSVQELSAVQAKKLEGILEKMMNKKVLVSYLVHPEILGGLKIKYGSNLIDDSIAGKLDRIEQVMKGGQ